MNDWMSRLPANIVQQPLNWIAIPGSHDSGTSSINRKSKPGPADSIDNVLRFVWKYTCFRSVVHKWSKTQTSTFSQQLNAGIRYFDIRVACLNNESFEPYIVHSLMSVPLAEAFREIADFLTVNEKEVVLLDLNHLYNMNDNQTIQMDDLLLGIFRSKLCQYNEKMNLEHSSSYAMPTLRSFWQSSKQVIAFRSYKQQEDSSQTICWPDDCIYSPWPQTTNPTEMVNFLEQHYGKGRRDSTRFHVTQGVLTPDAATVIRYNYKGLRHTLAPVAESALIKWLKGKTLLSSGLMTSQKHAGPDGVNVVITDFCEDYADYVDTVINLN